MAERKSADDDFNPRHRIVGAVILVALAVIFLPMLLSDRPPESAAPVAGETPMPDTRIVVAPVPPPVSAGNKGAGNAKPSAPEKSTAKPAPETRTVTVPLEPLPSKLVAESAPTQAETPKPEPAPAPEPKPAPVTRAAKAAPAAKPATADKGWIVQVGAFSHIENARRLQEKLKQKGYPALLDPASPQKGKTVRVEVGPYKDASSAKTVQARIHSELGIQGVVRAQ